MNLFSNSIFKQVLCKAPSVDEDVDLHFIAYVEKDGNLYELGKSHSITDGKSNVNFHIC